MKQEDIDPFWLLLLMGPFGSLGGAAALLRSGKELTKRTLGTAILNGGLVATAVSSIAFYQFGECQIWVAFGLGILSSLCGAKFMDLVTDRFGRLGNVGKK